MLRRHRLYTHIRISFRDNTVCCAYMKSPVVPTYQGIARVPPAVEAKEILQ